MKIEKANLRVDDVIDLDRPYNDRPLAMMLLCPRRAVWETRMSVREFVSDIDRAKAMIIGGIAHSALTFRYDCEKEVPIEVQCCDRVFKFRADGVCIINNEKYVVEVKLTFRNADGWAIWQLTAYMAFLGIKKGLLVGVRDNVVLNVELTEEDMERTRRWFLQNLEDWYHGRGVKRPGKHCDVCPFKLQCMNQKLV